MTPPYDLLLDLIQTRRTVRKFKPDPLPEGAIEKILKAARWAMSGANGQPWEFLVVTDPTLIKKLYETYLEEVVEYNFWMEQMRFPELRHPFFRSSGSPDEQLKKRKAVPGWASAPALIIVLGDGRRQWSTVMGAHTFGRHSSHLTDGLSNACTLIHLAASALGLGSQWVTIHIEDPFKRLLNIPDIITCFSIIPVGHPAASPAKGSRRPLSDMVHYDQYNLDKLMSNRQVLDYIEGLRYKAKAHYPEQGKAT